MACGLGWVLGLNFHSGMGWVGHLVGWVGLNKLDPRTTLHQIICNTRCSTHYLFMCTPYSLLSTDVLFTSEKRRRYMFLPAFVYFSDLTRLSYNYHEHMHI